MIRLDGVCVDREGRVVLDHVALAVGPGEVMAVEGTRASGKTALAEIVACVRGPDAGAVWIAGRNVIDLQRASLPFVRRNIGYLPQRPPWLADDCALENVLLPLGVRGVPLAEAREQAIASLGALGVGDLAGRPLHELSDGERRLVAVARALVGAPPILVLDEPIAGLGPADRGLVLERLACAAASGAAILCFTADESFAAALSARGGRRTRLEDGRLQGGAPAIMIVGGATSPRLSAGIGPEGDDPERDDARAARREP